MPKQITSSAAASWLVRLQDLTKNVQRIVAGIMSGTSMDSVDVAICSISGAGPSGTNGARVALKHFYSHPYDRELRSDLLAPAKLTARNVAELDLRTGELFAAACIAAVDSAGLKNEGLDLIGSHGQTIYHHSGAPGATRATLQLGDGDVISERTGSAVISDFRIRDIASGGEGAPLTPYADLILFGADIRGPRRAILNLGGIANLTVLDPNPSRVTGFDTGPANAPLDRLARIISGGNVGQDNDGRFASAGQVNKTLLDKLLNEDPYLKRRPPKSTGFELYGDEFVAKLISLHRKADNDLIATAVEFVAVAISRALNDFVLPSCSLDELVIAGGGSRNSFLVQRIAAHIAPIRIVQSDQLGVPAQAREAMSFALMANDALMGLATSLPGVTGAKRAAPLGKLSFPV